MATNPTVEHGQFVPSPRLPVDSLTGTPDAPGVDCETAALFRAWLGPLFDSALSWSALIGMLQARGFGLAIRDGRLVLTERDSGARLCTARFMGTSLLELSARIGRPHIRAHRDRSASGEFLNTPVQIS